MPSVNDLPTESHASILNFLHTASRYPQPEPPPRTGIARYAAPDPSQGIKEWLESDLRSPSLFPFNAARVRKSWRDILAGIPECWTRIVFDVSEDPKPLLEAFLWSKQQKMLQVVVFHRTSAPGQVDKVMEKRRVAAVTQALQPHISRCKSIVFEVTYSSSLPPPTTFFIQGAPELKELRLDCKIDDINVLNSPWMDTPTDRPILARSFPKLEDLSLTGFWFMYLFLHAAPEWLRSHKFAEDTGIYVSHFTFPQDGDYSLPKFAFYISELSTFTYLDLHDLSLAYEPEYSGNQVAFRPLSVNAMYLTFNSVSKGFLCHFYSIANIRPVSSSEALAFERCEIPHISEVQYADTLYLKNIIDDDEGTGLRRILQVWNGSTLEIHNCPSFNNTFLEWMRSEIHFVELDLASHGEGVPSGIWGQSRIFPSNSQPGFGAASTPPEMVLRWYPNQPFFEARGPFKTFPAESLSKLVILDSSNFTPALLQQVMKARNDTAFPAAWLGSYAHVRQRLSSAEMSTRQLQPLLDLSAVGRVPILTEDEKAWFKGYENLERLVWKARNAREFVQEEMMEMD